MRRRTLAEMYRVQGAFALSPFILPFPFYEFPYSPSSSPSLPSPTYLTLRRGQPQASCVFCHLIALVPLPVHPVLSLNYKPSHDVEPVSMYSFASHASGAHVHHSPSPPFHRHSARCTCLPLRSVYEYALDMQPPRGLRLYHSQAQAVADLQ
ncbi:hypothetical protein B0H19DRAFT_1375508 [Mycena capillaripes]|nr:hypothetical protein B0H19DRAFT_1375508 [Mycena capillaripes]